MTYEQLPRHIQSERTTLHCQVDHALGLLTKYNDRLQQELKDRRRVKKMIADYLAAQKDLETQAEERLEQYRDKLEKVNSVRDDLKSHIQVNSSFRAFYFISSFYGTSPLPTVSPGSHEAARRHRRPGAIALCWRSLHKVTFPSNLGSPVSARPKAAM